MSLGILGQREWFGVMALVVAVAIAAMFVNAGASTTVEPQDPPFPDQGLIVSDGGSPDSNTVAAPLPGTPSWVVSIFDTRADRPLLTNRATFDDLDFEFTGPPFPDFVDDQWQMVAEWGFDAPAGRYQFDLEVRGDLIVTIDGETHITPETSPDSRLFNVAFDHEGGPGSIRIEVRDRNGPFVLRWIDNADNASTTGVGQHTP